MIDDAYISAATAGACFVVHLVCLFMKMHLLVLALLQDNCLDLVRCVFLRKLFVCVRNITAFCQHLLRLIPIYMLVKSNYQPDISVCLW